MKNNSNFDSESPPPAHILSTGDIEGPSMFNMKANDLFYSNMDDRTLNSNEKSKLGQNFQFELKNNTGLYAHKWMGYIILGLSVLGGASTGVVSNFVAAEGPLLKNAWRF